jgi:hypothetical protein
LLEPLYAAVPSSFRLSPALDSRGVVAADVSLYLGLLDTGLPFRENLSEGSVLFVEYFFCTIISQRIPQVELQTGRKAPVARPAEIAKPAVGHKRRSGRSTR